MTLDGSVKFQQLFGKPTVILPSTDCRGQGKKGIASFFVMSLQNAFQCCGPKALGTFFFEDFERWGNPRMSGILPQKIGTK